MELIELKVHPISRKILQYHYGDEYGIIRIPRGDILWSHFTHRWTSTDVKLKKFEKLCTSHVFISFGSNKKSRKLNKNFFQVGVYLFQIHYNKLMEFVLAQNTIEDNASLSIKRFFDIYDITEDDLNSDSVYRQWQRFKTQIEKRRKTNKNILQKTVYQKNVNCNPLHRQESLARLDRFLLANCKNLFLSDNSLAKYLVLQSYIYTLFKKADQKVLNLANELGLNWRTIYHHSTKWKELLDTYEHLEKSYHSYIHD